MALPDVAFFRAWTTLRTKEGKLLLYLLQPADAYAAFADHGRVTANAIEADLEEAHGILQELERAGIDLHCLTWQLQNEGIQKFIDPYDALMQALAAKSQEFLSKRASR
jgi:hypothetical protein